MKMSFSSCLSKLRGPRELVLDLQRVDPRILVSPSPDSGCHTAVNGEDARTVGHEAQGKVDAKGSSIVTKEAIS